MPISNEQVTAHPFLSALYRSTYYPDHVVDRGRAVLLALCERIEAERPAGLAALYALTHAYTIAIHKAQGAEFPAVVIPLVTAHAALLGRTLLYTAFTRARQLVVIVGQRKALSMAVRDWRRAPRYTALGGLLDGTMRGGRRG